MSLGEQHRRTAWASLLIAMPLSLLLAVLQLQVELRAPLHFVVSLALDGPESEPTVRASFDAGQGFSPASSAAVTTIADGDLHRLRFDLPYLPVTKVRLEAVTTGGSVRIEEASITSSDGITLHHFSGIPIAAAGILSSRVAPDGTLESSVDSGPGAPAPQFLFLLPASSESLRAHRSTLRGAILFLKWLLPISVLAFGLAWATRWFKTGPPRVWPWLRGLRDEGQKEEHGEPPPKISPGFIALALLVFVGFLSLRSWSNLSTPNLYVEDATHYFNFYYGGSKPLAAVLQRPHGYYNIFNNVVAWIASTMDVRLQPTAYLGVSLACGVITSTCLLFSGLFKTRWILLVTPTVLGLMGMNHIFYYVTLTYQMYVVVVLLICLMLFRPPRSAVGLVLVGLLYALLIWSGPYSVLAVPAAVLFLLLFKDKRRSALMAWVIVCTLIYSFTADSLVRLENLLSPNVLESMLRTLVDKVVFLGWIESIPVRVVVAATVAAVLYLLRRDAYFTRYSLILAAVAAESMAPLFLSVKYADYPDPYPCHVFIAQFFWLAWLLLACDRLLLAGRAPRWLPGVVVAGFLALVYADNRAVSYRGSTPPMAELRPFLEAVHAVEQLGLETRNSYVMVRYPTTYFPPNVKVGSRQRGARRLDREDPQLRTVNARYLR
ncbi:MAG: hypothetical protein GY722_14945 [bacterium]|nr:hypothetical protein [bacterium]